MSPMVSDFMICPEMFGNGSVIGLLSIITGNHLMISQRVLPQVLSGYSEVEDGIPEEVVPVSITEMHFPSTGLILQEDFAV